MPRVSRVHSTTGVYHVISRGTGFQSIFEEDTDRDFFLQKLYANLPATKGEMYAWCFMDNHVHLVVHMELSELSKYMHSVLGCYAAWFNKKYGKCGHLFQDRFYSEPIVDEAHILSAVRYVHQNPERAGICRTNEYPWSSYAEYIGHAQLVSPEPIMTMLGSLDAFEDMHSWFPDTESWADYDRGHRLTDEAARRVLLGAFGEDILCALPSMIPQDRDELICYMAAQGTTPKQLQRITGIGRTIIARAMHRERHYG